MWRGVTSMPLIEHSGVGGKALLPEEIALLERAPRPLPALIRPDRERRWSA